MNLPRYKFAKESQPNLLQFLKVAKEQKLSNKNCDRTSYELWNKLLPLDRVLSQKLDEFEASNVITLSSDDEESEVVVTENVDAEIETAIQSSISDIACTIKENLETKNDLSVVAKKRLLTCSTSDLEKLFELLEQTLGNEEIYYFGVASQDISSNDFVTIFCHNLLIPRIRKEYCDKLQSLVDNFAPKHSVVLRDECLSALQELTDQESRIFIQYMKKLDMNFQSMLVRDFLLAIGSLNENYLLVVENLLNGQVEYEALNKLVEMLSNIAEGHVRDKNFGKLLMQTIDVLGPNLVHLEQPLKHIIAGHKSVWRSKLEKKFNTCYEDSLLFSQSFRD